MNQKMRFGIIGLGKMGLLHASLLNIFPEVELVALCDKSILMTRLFKKVFSSTGIHVINNLDQFSKFQVDAVYITTPISSHASIIKELVEKNITRNIFSEKTLALNYVQAKELCAIAERAGGVNMVGYMKRFSVVFGKAKELLSNGDIGELKSFKAYAFSSDFGLTKKAESSLPRGGALKDIGCHVIDLAFWLLGDLEVQDPVSIVNNQDGSDISASFTVLNSSGLTGQFNVSQNMMNYRMPEFGLSIEGSKGKIDVNDDRLLLELNDGAKQKWYKHDLNDNAYFSIGDSEYFRENQNFVNSLLKGTPCESSFDSASKVDLLIDQVKKKGSQNE